jgi:putative hydrolase of the HAD superfamily
MPLTTLFFDLDDTLLETHDAHMAALEASCKRAVVSHPEWTVARMRAAFVRTYTALEAELEAGRLTFTAQVPFRIRTWEETLRACGLSPDLGVELAHVYLAERRRRYTLYPEVPALLDSLVRKYRLVLVTNGLGELQREKVAAVGLERWFERIVVSGEVGSWKPDPGIFHHALGLAEARPEETVMLGDSLQRDIAGAGPLGIRTVWVRRYAHLKPIPPIRPDVELPDFTRLQELLDRWS